MATITEFLLARIAEDEAAAHRCAAVFPGSWDVEDRGWHAHVVCDGPIFHYVSELNQQNTSAEWLGGVLGMIADFQPSRVLSECAAKRALLDQHEEAGPVCITCERAFPCPTLSILASVYKDHPDYDESWATN
jgi:hypothetical protein